MWKWKAFDRPSWNALLSALARIKGAADASASTASEVGENLATLAELTEGSLAGKQDKQSAVSCTIPAAGWAEDTTSGYPYYCDLPVPGVTARDRAELTLAASSLSAAVECGLCQTCETLEGKIRLRAAAAPAADLAAEYWIEQGKG